MDIQKGTRWKRFKRFLRRRYRLVILNDTTFGEKFSLRLSPYGLLIGALAITIVMTTLVISLVAFTPLREYIPGYGDVTERKQILRLSLRADSLEQSIETRDLYMTSIINAITEKVETKGPKPKRDTTGKYSKINIVKIDKNKFISVINKKINPKKIMKPTNDEIKKQIIEKRMDEKKINENDHYDLNDYSYDYCDNFDIEDKYFY